MIDLRKVIKERNAWLWSNRARSRAYLCTQTGLSESRVKHILTEMRRAK